MTKKSLNAMAREAQAKGLKHFNSGEPCIRGHTSDRVSTSTTCLECKSFIRKNKITRYRSPPADVDGIIRNVRPCLKCGCTERYAKSNSCIACKAKRDKEAPKENKRLYFKNYYHKNKSAFLFKFLLRQKNIKTATPKWISKNQLKEIAIIYKNCPEGCHVDHIVPIGGKNCCGWHVPWNLQYLSAKENLQKKNKFPTCQKSMQPACFDNLDNGVRV